jgi:hypothetical protein
MEDLDRHATNAPFPHFPSGGFVEIDGIATGEGKAVVIHLVDLARCPDPEDGTAWPASPVGGGTIHYSMPEGGTQGCLCAISEMITLALGVGRGADFLNGGPLDRRFVRR